MEQNKNFRLMNRIIRGMFRSLFNIKVVNPTKFDVNQSVIYVVNHNNWIDPFVVLSYLENENMTHLLAETSDLMGSKFAQWLSGKTDDFIVGVERDDTTSRTASMKRMVSLLKKGNSIIVFPEGRYSKEESKMFPFYQGAFALSKKYDVPIVPIMFNGNFELYIRKPITMKIGEPMWCGNRTKEQFTQDVYNYMHDNMPEHPGEGPRLKVGKKFITGLAIKSRSDLEFDEKIIRHKDHKDIYK